MVVYTSSKRIGETMINFYLEEDDNPQYRECDMCKEYYRYDRGEGWVSEFDGDLEFCSAVCAVQHDQEYEKEMEDE